MGEDLHRQLHKNLVEFLKANNPGMVPSRSNPGREIQRNFTIEELKNAIATSYKTTNKYDKAAKAFFEQFK